MWAMMQKLRILVVSKSAKYTGKVQCDSMQALRGHRGGRMQTPGRVPGQTVPA